MIYCFDIDGTLCTKTNGDYEKAQPFHDRIAVLKGLHEAGHVIKLFTSRGSTTGIDWRAVTLRQMHEWNVRYHVLIMGKPEADIFIDDKAFNAKEWFSSVTDEEQYMLLDQNQCHLIEPQNR